MAWQNEMTIIVRHIIGDIDSTNYTFTDARIEEAILVAAQLFMNEVDVSIVYQIDVDNGIMNPDPTTTPTANAWRDDDFIALVCLRCGLLLTSSLMRTYSLKAISIRDGASSIDTRGIVAGLQQVYNALFKQYDEVKLAYQAGKIGWGKGILGPYSPGSDTANRGYVDYRAGFFN